MQKYEIYKYREKRKLFILGSTGSIGRNAVEIAYNLSELIEVSCLIANSNVKLLAQQATLLRPRYVVTADKSKLELLKGSSPSGCEVLAGEEAISELIKNCDFDILLCATVGLESLIPVIEAIKRGKRIALASKEILVSAGCVIMPMIEKYKAEIIPVDSEHSAIFQCVDGKNKDEISKIVLTASGGPFRDSSKDEMIKASWENAVKHPVWDMGPKVTIDSASLMNKALELIEAYWLFDISEKNIEVLIHPESIIHSMVEFVDGAILAQMGVPDMKLPIQYALTYPFRSSANVDALDLRSVGSLHFYEVDCGKFPSLEIARRALRIGETMPAVMNAANEIAVARFKNKEIKFTDIWKVIELTMQAHNVVISPSLEDIIEVDKWARNYAVNI